eukprot:89461_1
MALTFQRLSHFCHAKAAPLFISSIRACNSDTKLFQDKWPEQIPSAFIEYVSDKYNLNINNKDLEEYQSQVSNLRTNWQTVDRIFDQYKNQIYPDTPTRTFNKPKPGSKENKFGEWIITTKIPPTNPNGPLKNKTFGIKDNISIAGLPCQNGSEIFQNYIPSTDATIVTRILQAGGTIIGKTQCEKLCYSGGSHTSFPHSVKNPHNPLHHAGGSSSGSGAAVACGSCDIAIGGDQGGSIRLPACWCGCVGFKQTYGLVPYTGAASLDAHFDHLGPMAKTVHDVVETLKVISGKDGYDYRQLNAPEHGDKKFISSLEHAMTFKDISGIKIGLVKQAFSGCEQQTEDNVRNAVNLLKGNKVIEVDVPLHDDAVAIWLAIGMSGQMLTMYLNGGISSLPRGAYDVGVSEKYVEGIENGQMQYSPINIINVIAGEWMIKQYGAGYFAKGTELSRILKNEYERVMDENDLDVLIYPTIKFTAMKMPENVNNCSVNECVEHAFANVANTMPSSITGHPTLSIPVEYNKENGLPIGMSIVAKNYQDAKCIHVANVYEKLRGPLKTL